MGINIFINFKNGLKAKSKILNLKYEASFLIEVGLLINKKCLLLSKLIISFVGGKLTKFLSKEKMRVYAFFFHKTNTFYHVQTWQNQQP